MLVQKCPKYDLKIKIFYSFKKHPQEFNQAITSVSNLRLNVPFIPSLEHPESFRYIYGP